MKWLKRFFGLVIILFIVSIIIVIIIINPFGSSPLNKYTKNGDLTLSGLSAPVKVKRDEKGMAYIYAQNMEDLFLAQGFITAQDRLFQMELTKLFASGRISELAGEKAMNIDIRMRTLGFYRNAKKHIGLLGDKPRTFLQKYVEGVNEFIKTRPKSIHLEFTLAGIKPEPWKMADPLTILYYMGWGSAANVGTEIIAQMLVEKLGPARAAEIFPITINPDDETTTNSDNTNRSFQTMQLGFEFNKTILSFLTDGPLKMGSNNWTTSGDISPGSKPDRKSVV